MPAPVLSLRFDGSADTCQRNAALLKEFLAGRGISTGGYDHAWHSRFETTPVDDMDDLEGDAIDAGYTVVRASNGDWHLFAPAEVA